MDSYRPCSGFPFICLYILMGFFIHLNAKDLYVRVVDGTNGNQGKVEVFDSGTKDWYPICRDMWDDHAANVVCRMLGYTRVYGFAMSMTYSDKGWNRNVSCKGNENLLSECKLTEVGFRTCYLAGVDCSKCGSPDGFFLMGGYLYIIRMSDVTWSYIHFAKPDAYQIRGLSYDYQTDTVYWTDHSNVKNLSLATGKISTMFTKEKSNAVYLGLAVDAYKRLLFFGDHNHADIWKVDLDNSEEKVKILDGATTVQHIEVDPEQEKIYWLDLHYDVVREADYNGKNSRVVMAKIRQFEFSEMFTLDVNYVYITNSKAKYILVHGRYNNTTYYIDISTYNNYKGITQWNDHIYLISSTESRLIKVSKDGSSVELTGPPIKYSNILTNLRHYASTVTEVFIRVANAVKGNAGNIQVYDNATSEWYSVCNDTWGDEEATVACTMLGYTSARGKAVSGKGSGQGIDMNVQCWGDENSLNYCQMTPEFKSNCDYAGIDCELSGRPRGFFLMFSKIEIYRMDDVTHSYIMRPTSTKNMLYGLGYDDVTDFVFWSDGYDIYYASLSNETDGLFVKGPDGSFGAIREVVVDSSNRKLFYNNFNNGNIWLLELDQQSKIPKKFYDKAFSGIKMAVDPVRKLIFWLDYTFQTLREINYDGSSERIIAALKGSIMTTFDDLDFTIDDDKAYIHIGQVRAIYIFNRFNSSSDVINITNFYTRSVTQLDDYLYCANTQNQPLVVMNKDGSEQTLVGPPLNIRQTIRHFTYKQENAMSTISTVPTKSEVTATTSTTSSPTSFIETSSQPTTAVLSNTSTVQSTAAQTTTTRTTEIFTEQPLSSTETIVIAAVVAVVMLILGIGLGIFIYRRCFTSLQKIPSNQENYINPLPVLQGQENGGYDMLTSTNTVSSNAGNEYEYIEIQADNNGLRVHDNNSNDTTLPVYVEPISEKDNIPGDITSPTYFSLVPEQSNSSSDTALPVQLEPVSEQNNSSSDITPPVYFKLIPEQGNGASDTTPSEHLEAVSKQGNSSGDTTPPVQLEHVSEQDNIISDITSPVYFELIPQQGNKHNSVDKDEGQAVVF